MFCHFAVRATRTLSELEKQLVLIIKRFFSPFHFNQNDTDVIITQNEQ